MRTCQNPAVRSMDEKIVLPDHLIVLMHLLTGNCEYLLNCDISFTAL